MRKRPCNICRKWFLPNPRAGDRQRTCSEPACQRERHRRACSDWHRRNSDYDRENRLRARLAHPGPPAPGSSHLVSWAAARDAVGLEVLVVLEELLQVLTRLARDAVARQEGATTGESARVPPRVPRDDIANSARPP